MEGAPSLRLPQVPNLCLNFSPRLRRLGWRLSSDFVWCADLHVIRCRSRLLVNLVEGFVEKLLFLFICGSNLLGYFNWLLESSLRRSKAPFFLDDMRERSVLCSSMLQGAFPRNQFLGLRGRAVEGLLMHGEVVITLLEHGRVVDASVPLNKVNEARYATLWPLLMAR